MIFDINKGSVMKSRICFSVSRKNIFAVIVALCLAFSVWAASPESVLAASEQSENKTVPTGAILITNDNILTIDWTQTGAYYALNEDIYLTDEWIPIDNFAGSTFDGQGHSINNLYVLERSDREYAGLFGSIYGNDVKIKDVGINIGRQGVSATSSFFSYAGGLIGACENAVYLTIENCYVTGNVSVSSFFSFTGGLIGACNYSTTLAIKNCYASGNVDASAYYSAIGGLIGFCDGDTLTIENCYSTCNVDTTDDPATAGGLIGECLGNDTTVENCYASGNINAPYSYFTGGLIGYNGGNAIIVNCYRLSTQIITGRSFDESGKPLMPSQMVVSSNFIGWDFDLVWGYKDGVNDGYPILRTFFSVEPTTTIAITSIATGNKQANLNFPIKSANGKGYTVYISETGAVEKFKQYDNVNYNSKGVHIKGLANGNKYRAYVEYNDGNGNITVSSIVDFTLQ